MSEALWQPPSEPTPEQAALRSALRTALPQLLARAEAGTGGGVIVEVGGAVPGRAEFVAGEAAPALAARRSCLRLRVEGHAVMGGRTLALGAALLIDRASRAILDLQLRALAR
jgi:hypothetical protein